jgi:hypothetical protein
VAEALLPGWRILRTDEIAVRAEVVVALLLVLKTLQIVEIVVRAEESLPGWKILRTVVIASRVLTFRNEDHEPPSDRLNDLLLRIVVHVAMTQLLKPPPTDHVPRSQVRQLPRSSLRSAVSVGRS